MGIESLLRETVAAVYRDSTGNELPYRLLAPRLCKKGELYPLVLFLHGSEEKGTDNVKQIGDGFALLASPEHREQYPSFIAAPQCPLRRWWTEPNILPLLFKITEKVREDYPVDGDRIYITGYSTGAFGTWKAVEQDPEYFAAAVPVSGGGNIGKAPRLARVPVWAFHGSNDPVIDVKFSREMIEALQKAGGMPHYTEYPHAGHDIWRFVYRSPKLLKWLYSQVRDRGENALINIRE